jgi:hypothetical protein
MSCHRSCMTAGRVTSMHVQGGHFIFENYFTKLREGILVKLEEMTLEVDTQLDSMAVDMTSLFDRRKPLLLAVIHSSKVCVCVCVCVPPC